MDFFSALVEIDNSWINIEDIGLPLIEGFVATADQSVTSSSCQILSEQEVLAADWETAAIARICSINGVRCCVLRGVSDLAFGIDGYNNEVQLEDYRRNTLIIMNKLITEYLQGILPQVKNK